MPKIKISTSGDFKKTIKFLDNAANSKQKYYKILKKYGEEGVRALSVATPVDTGKTARSWGYVIEDTGKSLVITWTNSNTNRGISIVMLIQNGHGTRNGGYVQGKDFVNPAIKPIFDEIAEEIVKEINDV